LAQTGDRLTKLTLTFTYGATDPDVGLALITASDYQETQYRYEYVQCEDAGVDAAADAVPVVLRDAAPSPDVQPRIDAVGVVDLGLAVDAEAPPVTIFDAQPPSSPDADAKADAGVPLVADAGLADARISQDTRPYWVPDAATPSDAPLVPVGGKDAAPPSGPSNRSTGCSVAAGSTSGGYLALALVGLLMAARLRKRRAG
jgi:MYXO-CTERM domain-containing protein